MIVSFTKMHGLGNDFMVVAQPAPGWPDAATVRRLAERRTGVGFDQLMLVTPAPDAAHHAGYRVFNADGSAAGQCGNGARCVARWIAERDGLEGEIRLASPVGTVRARRVATSRIELDMGIPQLEPAAIPLRAARRQQRYRLSLGGQPVEFGAVSVGNPHAVLLVDSVEHAPVGILGPQLESHEAFPQRVNVGFMQTVDRGHIRLRVYERGAGETRACGTGACAAVVIGRLWGLLETDVEVVLPGGVLRICWPGDGRPVTMTGEAVRVYDGTLES